MTDLYKPRPDRLPRFRFGLRTLFVLLKVFGLWLGVQVKWVSDRRAARQWIAEHQPEPEAAGAGGLSGPRYTWYEIKPFPLVLKVLGEQPVYTISVAVGPDDHKQVERLRKLFPEASVLRSTPVQNGASAPIK